MYVCVYVCVYVCMIINVYTILHNHEFSSCVTPFQSMYHDGYTKGRGIIMLFSL